LSYYDDVGDFHRKFDLATYRVAKPDMPDHGVLRFRSRFLVEEMAELLDALGMPGPAASLRSIEVSIKTVDDTVLFVTQKDLNKAADALADIVYVALGTAHMMGLPFDAVWGEVQRANMAKERASGDDDSRSLRKSALDVVKPAGWVAPNHKAAIDLARAMWEGANRKKDAAE
jgi:predicted HAD superfamily Cof-like phosphohydrolase